MTPNGATNAGRRAAASVEEVARAPWAGAPVAVGIVSNSEVSRSSLVRILRGYPEFVLLGVETGAEPYSELFAHGDLQLLVVNLPLDYHAARSPAIDFVRRAKAARPEVRVLLLKRRSEEQLVRASLDAGADGCALQTISSARLALAIKALAVGAVWLDPGILDVILHGSSAAPAPVRPDERPAEHRRLSPREQQILTLMSEGQTNDEIATALECSTATVKTHLSHIFRKLDVNDRVSAVVTALRFALI